MKSVKEIVTALHCCEEKECLGCPYKPKNNKCNTRLMRDAGLAILYWYAENARKEKGLAAMKEMPSDLHAEAPDVMSLSEWAVEIHENAVEHGWWDTERSFGEIVALCHSELSEALEEYRDGKPLAYQVQSYGIVQGRTVTDTDKFFPNQKIEGIAVEMIDCLIRILDWCGKEGVDVDGILARKHEYNKTRPYRHGGKVL